MLKGLIRKVFYNAGYEVLSRQTITRHEGIPEASEGDSKAMAVAGKFSMTPTARQWALLQAVKHVSANRIAGDIVECGVWKGGNLILCGLLLKDLNDPRPIWGYDTFEGMSEPTEDDYRFLTREQAMQDWQIAKRDDHVDWCYSPLDEVKSNFENEVRTDELRLVKGKVEDTLQNESNLPAKISILRLDTDWYESTKVELEVLYPRLVPGGILIIDDYGEWAGAKRAVDEFFASENVWMHRVDYSCRLMIKPGS